MPAGLVTWDGIVDFWMLLLGLTLAGATYGLYRIVARLMEPRP